MLWWLSMKAGSTAMPQRPRDRVPSGSMLALPDPRRPDRANLPTDFWWSLFFDCTGMIYMHWVPIGQTVNKEYYVEVLRELRTRFHRKRPALFKSGQWHFPQDNALVHNSILAAKIYNALRRNRIEPKIKNILRMNQNGFQRNRSITSKNVTIHWILEGVHAKNLEVAS